MLSNKTYDFLKWMMYKVFPATIWLISTLGIIWNVDVALVVETVSAVGAFIVIITGLSARKYYQMLNVDPCNGVSDDADEEDDENEE